MENEHILFLDISCEDCMISKVDFLNEQNGLTRLFFLGDSTNSKLVKWHKDVNSDFDLNSKYLEYETGISLPLYIGVKKGKIKEHTFISEENKIAFVERLNLDK